jgi:predicted DCC family thiol-disulfide oxidoreductase YuxK
MKTDSAIGADTNPVLLFNDECGVCRRITKWVKKSAATTTGEMTIEVAPIGADPARLRSLNPDLDIWDAYATIHMLMPDGSMKVGGEAVAETLRRMPNTEWFAWTFALNIFGLRPFQLVVDAGYTLLAAVRPLFGCESCGMPNVWLRPITGAIRWLRNKIHGKQHRAPSPHFSGLHHTHGG